MGTAFSKILTNSAMSFIDDIRWSEQLQQNPAVFFRSKSLILKNAIPRFNRPPQIKSVLKKYTDCQYDSVQTLYDTPQTAPFTINTGKTGYELCSVGIVTTEDNGDVIYTPCDFTYNSATGDVVVQQSVSAGQRVDCDFYKDGHFESNLDDTQMRILGLCIAVDWHLQFSMNYLSVANLVTDKTFALKSPAEHIRVNTDRQRMLQSQLNSELLAYEQNLYEMNAMKIPTFEMLNN